MSSNSDDVDESPEESIPPLKLRKPQKIVIPRRQPSVVGPAREIVYVTADKTTCAKCDCYLPRDAPYVKPPKLDPCQYSPSTLYELTSAIVDQLPLPEAFSWTVDKVAEWMCQEVGLPRYRECIEDNFIDGMRLLMLEDASKLVMINIRDFRHVQIITAKVRELYSTDFILFARSLGLPPRRPGVHCTWFKSRTGPPWGIRQNWTRSDILRWMKILDPAPIHRDHWELVWYMRPEFPKTKFARLPPRAHDPAQRIPHWVKPEVECRQEYMTPRKFRLLKLPEEKQLIWMERQLEKLPKKKQRREKKTKKESTLIPRPVDVSGLTGIKLVLARRLMPKKKFFC